MSNYSKKVEEQPSFNSDWFGAGIHENIYVQKVEMATWGDGKECADVIFGDKQGRTISSRMFPFQFNDKLTKNVKEDGVEKKVPFTEEEQLDSYLIRFKHIFSKTVGEENYDKAISKATDFKSFVGILSKMSLEANPASKPFRLMVISKYNEKAGKNYNSVPTWSGGVCESMDVNPSKLKFDEAKYGAKKKESSATEIPSASKEKMPWED